MKRFLIIADDFTGANDAGVQLTRRGIPTHVVFEPSLIKDDEDSYVLDTESRGMEPEVAYNTIKGLLADVNTDSFDYIIKKTDSTLRGNIPSEVRALDDILPGRTIVFSPAFPDIGRITKNGIHYFNDKPLMETEFAKDPVKPITTDCLKALLEQAFDDSCTHLTACELANADLCGHLYSFDCVTNADLINIVSAFENSSEVKTLWVGSAGICDAILNYLDPVKPSVGLITSVSAATSSQVKFAEAKGVKLVKVPVHELINKKDDSYAYEVISYLKQGYDTLLISSATYDRSDLELARAEGKRLGLDNYRLSQTTQNIMSSLMELVLKQAQVSGLFLSGGDTAIGFIKKVNSLGSDIIGEVSNGIPIMQLNGGDFHSLKVITKAGGFGNEDAIVYSLRKLKETSLTSN